MIVLTDAAFTAMLVAPSRASKCSASTFVSVIVIFSASSAFSTETYSNTANWEVYTTYGADNLIGPALS